MLLYHRVCDCCSGALAVRSSWTSSSSSSSTSSSLSRRHHEHPNLCHCTMVCVIVVTCFSSTFQLNISIIAIMNIRGYVIAPSCVWLLQGVSALPSSWTAMAEWVKRLLSRRLPRLSEYRCSSLWARSVSNSLGYWNIQTLISNMLPHITSVVIDPQLTPLPCWLGVKNQVSALEYVCLYVCLSVCLCILCLVFQSIVKTCHVHAYTLLKKYVLQNYRPVYFIHPITSLFILLVNKLSSLNCMITCLWTASWTCSSEILGLTTELKPPFSRLTKTFWSRYSMTFSPFWVIKNCILALSDLSAAFDTVDNIIFLRRHKHTFGIIHCFILVQLCDSYENKQLKITVLGEVNISLRIGVP